MRFKETVIIGSDSKRIELKEKIRQYLQLNEIPVEDAGAGCYVDIAKDVAEDISKGKYSRGILICRTGIGMQIAANKIPGAYAVRCHDVQSAIDSRIVNNANVLTFGEIEEGLAKKIVDAWIDTKFSGEEKYTLAIEKLKEIEYSHGTIY